MIPNQPPTPVTVDRETQDDRTEIVLSMEPTVSLLRGIAVALRRHQPAMALLAALPPSHAQVMHTALPIMQDPAVRAALRIYLHEDVAEEIANALMDEVDNVPPVCTVPSCDFYAPSGDLCPHHEWEDWR